MTSFNFKKSALAVSASAALVALSLTTTAQAANDVGQLIVNGQISNTTCLLSLGDGGATGGNSRTLNLGTYSTNAAAGVNGFAIGSPQTAILSLKAADGVNPCQFNSPAAFWDVGVSIPRSAYDYLPNGIDTALRNTATTNAATGVGVMLRTSFGPSVTVGTRELDGYYGTPTYGTLMGGRETPSIPAAHVLAVTAQLVRTTGAIGAGVWTYSLPLNVYYR